MNSRRSFLRLLGISAVAAPAAAKLAVGTNPVSAVAINAKYREQEYGLRNSPEWIEAQREINHYRANMLRLLNDSSNYRLIS